MADYVRTGGETLVNTSTQYDQFNPHVTVLDNGNYVIAWADHNAQSDRPNYVRAQLFAADGTRIGGEITVSTDETVYQREDSVTALAGGGFAVGWSTIGNTPYSGSVRLYDAAGHALGGPVQITQSVRAGGNDVHMAGLANGTIIATYQEDGEDPSRPEYYSQGVFGQLLSATGAKIGGPFLVNSQLNDSQYGSKPVALAGGGFVIAWTDNYFMVDGNGSAVRAQVFDASGARVGKEIAVNSTVAGSQFTVDALALADGGFAIEFGNSNRAAGSVNTARVQVFDASGAPVGGEHDLGTVGGQLSQLADGGFAHVYSRDTSAPDVFLQHYDASFTAIGAVQTVNTSLAGAQGQSDVAAIAGGFVVTYYTGDPAADGSGNAILMQRFALPASVGTRGDDVLAAPSDAAWTVNGGLGNDDMTGGAGNDYMVGGKGNDVMRGGAGDDRLSGGEGDDTLYGGTGRDVLNGGVGDDRLVGGTGLDVMIGGRGHDTFAFTTAELANPRGTIDARIVDYSRADGDHVDLSAIDAVAGGQNDAFSFIGGAAFSGTAGQLRVETIDGQTFALGDTNGDGVADLVIRFDGAPALVASDFTL